MPGSMFWLVLILLVGLVVLPGDALRVVLLAGLVIVAGVFVVRLVVHLHQVSADRRTTHPRLRPGVAATRPLISADAGGSPTLLASADSSQVRDAA
jgi:hypothetical protein